MNRSIHAGLDRPIWAALTTTQAQLGQGDELARRYHPEVAPFAAVASETPAAFQSLHRLLAPREQVALLSEEPVDPIAALHMSRVGTLHQMVATHHEAAPIDDQDVIQLGRMDVDDMLELVQKTKPGPFGKRTYEMGKYIGIREHGRLIAMAGERMRLDGYVEISAVCVDENWRGHGLAGRLVQILRRGIEHRGDTAFLHVFGDNRSAIGLYERLGFELRRTYHLTRIQAADPASTTAR